MSLRNKLHKIEVEHLTSLKSHPNKSTGILQVGQAGTSTRMLRSTLAFAQEEGLSSILLVSFKSLESFNSRIIETLLQEDTSLEVSITSYERLSRGSTELFYTKTKPKLIVLTQPRAFQNYKTKTYKTLLQTRLELKEVVWFVILTIGTVDPRALEDVATLADPKQARMVTVPDEAYRILAPFRQIL